MRRRAFTLVEVTVVCAILAMVAALALPNFVAMKAARERKETYNAVLRLAQQGREAAIQEGTTHTLTLADSGTKVALQRERPADTTNGEDPRQTTTGDQSAEQEDVASVSLPDGVTVGEITLGDKPSSTSEFVLHFYPDGRSEGGGFEMVDDGAKRSLSVDNRGIASLLDGDLPQAETQSWEAGQYEQRTSG